MRRHRLLGTIATAALVATVAVAPVGAQPVTAVDDDYTGLVDTPLTVDAPGVLANDSGAGALSVVGGPDNGSVALAQDGSFTYSPDPGFVGVDTFTYELASGSAEEPIDLGSVAGLDVSGFRAARLNGIVLFTGSEGGSGAELWRTDGTVAGTQLVKDLNPGFRAGVLSLFVVIGDTAYFAGEDPAGGVELWRSDGTAVGTTRVADIAPGAVWSVPEGLIESGGKLFFTASVTGNNGGQSDRVPFAYDPATDQLSQLVLNFDPAQDGGRFAATKGLAESGSGVLFDAYDDIFVTDGTAAGTVEIWDDPDEKADFSVGGSVGGTAFFRAGPFNGPIGLWRTDGATFEEVLINAPVVVGTTDAHLYTAGNGQNLLAISPAGAVTDLGQLFPDIQPQPDQAWGFASLGSTAFINAAGTQFGEPDLWVSDGTVAGTSLLVDAPFGIDTFFLDEANGEMWFWAFRSPTSSDYRLFRSDGTVAGTREYEPDTVFFTSYARPFDAGEYLLVARQVIGSPVTLWRFPYNDADASQATVTIDVRPAAVVITVSEIITVADGPLVAFPPGAVQIVVNENILVTDEVTVDLGPPPVRITISENVVVTDNVSVDLGPPPLRITVVENVTVTDDVTVDLGPPPLRITVNENIVVTDDVSVDLGAPPVRITVIENVTVADVGDDRNRSR